MSNERIPPQAVEAEQSILGAVLVNAQALKIALAKLTPEHFYVPKHRHIFQAIWNINKNGGAVDLLTVPNELEARGLLAEVGTRKYLFDLTDSVVNFANTEKHCELVAEAAAKNAIIHACTQIIEDTYDTESLSRGLLIDMSATVERIRRFRTENIAVRSGKDLARTLIESAEEASLQGLCGFRTGFQSLDNLTLGLQPGYFVILAARPSMGKTALALTIASKVGIRDQVPTLFISLEMPEKSIVSRFATIMGEVSSYRLRRGKLRDYEVTRVSHVASALAEAPFYLADVAVATLGQINNLVEQSVETLGVKLVFIDYLGLIRHRGRTRENEVSEISQGLKSLTNVQDISLVALSQLSRKAEGVVPQLDHLRDSGSLEQDADQVIFIYRPNDKNGERLPQGKIIVAKFRDGRTGSIDFNFEGSKMRFTMIDKVHTEEEEYYGGQYEVDTETGNAIGGRP